MRLLLLLAGLLLLKVGQVTAQSPPIDTLTFHPQGSARNLSGAVLPGSGWLLLAETRHPKTADSTYLGQLWLDKHLRPARRLEVGLRGRRLFPEAVQAMGQRALVRLSGRDTLRLLVLDTLGRIVARANEALPQPRADYDLVLPELPGTPGVLTLQRWKGSAPWVLAYRGADLRLRWQQRLTVKGVRVSMAADSTHLWLTLMRYPTHRHPVTTTLCYSLLTGAELSRRQLGPTNAHNQRVVSTQRLNADHSLWLAGHAYRGRAVNTHHSGDLFTLRLSPEGQVLDSAQLATQQLPQQLGARGRRVSWQALVPEPDGGLRLVGETYTTTPAIASYLRGMVSLFLLSFDVLRPKDVVLLRLLPNGQAETPRLVPLTADRCSYVWPSYASPLAMELFASENHGFRTRGLGADNQTLVLRSPQQIQALNLRSGMLQLLRAAPAGGNLDVLYTGPDYVLLAEGRSLRGGIRLVRIGLPAAIH